MVFRILDKWRCSTDEQLMLLGISSRSTLNKYKEASGGIRLSADLQERMSYILNIHKSLRVLFSVDESIYGWVRKPTATLLRRAQRHGRHAGVASPISHEAATRLHAWRGRHGLMSAMPPSRELQDQQAFRIIPSRYPHLPL